ncbi:hypothetical protein MYXO_01574 [Myxococcaceae bacterium]|jgi:uncharacterized membrane protein YkvA (DUF1232 family)|nr:hypothetical protein MYXO_01574 [Myxococcaceae bacterium]
MATTSLKITFTLDEKDLAYFRDLFKKVKRSGARLDALRVSADVKALIDRVRKAKKVPSFVEEAMANLETLVEMLGDEDYALPAKIAHEVLAAVAYFSNPQDLVPDHVPGLGYLDDAIMIKFLEDQFQHELAGYQKFCRFREGANVLPWAEGADARLAKRLAEKRKEIRAEIARREAGGGSRTRLRDIIRW